MTIDDGSVLDRKQVSNNSVEIQKESEVDETKWKLKENQSKEEIEQLEQF